MEETTNLKLPLLVPNQSQKEITHNEALVILDNLVNNGVKDKDLTTPPKNPSQNDLYIVGVGATGEWVGKDNQLAFYDNGWRFCQARQGTKYWVIDENCIYVFNMTSWSKFSGGEGGGSSGSGEGGATSLSQLDDVSLTSISKDDILKFNGGSFVNSKSLNNLEGVGINCEFDEDNKLMVKSDYVLFDNNGGDSKIKANKSSTTQTASHLFQNNYSGRAEFGLIGNDDFSLKVSSDGGEWKEAFVVDKATGNIDFKGEITKNGSIIGEGGNGVYQKINEIEIGNNIEVIINNLDISNRSVLVFEDIKVSADDVSIYCSISSNGTNYSVNNYRGISIAHSIGKYENIAITNNNQFFNLLSNDGGWKLSSNALLNGKLEVYNTSITNIYSDFSYIAINDGFEKSSGNFRINERSKTFKLFLSSGNFTSVKIKQYIIN